MYRGRDASFMGCRNIPTLLGLEVRRCTYVRHASCAAKYNSHGQTTHARAACATSQSLPRPTFLQQSEAHERHQRSEAAASSSPGLHLRQMCKAIRTHAVEHAIARTRNLHAATSGGSRKGESGGEKCEARLLVKSGAGVKLCKLL